MKPEQLEQWLLLEQSGELTPRQKLRLDAELAASEAARRLRDQLRTIAGAVSAPAARPAADAAARIAARLRPAARPAFTFVAAWKPTLAFAGTVETAAVTTAAEEEEWSDPLDSEFTELESLLASIASENSLETTEL